MAKIIVDQENNAEVFWDAFASASGLPKFAEPLNDCNVTEIECSSAEADAFVAYASRLPGWADGPAYAKHPVIVQK